MSNKLSVILRDWPVSPLLPGALAVGAAERAPESPELARGQRLVREVNDLARDRPRCCQGCGRMMRYLPTADVPLQRAGSRGDSFRCQPCQIAPELIDAVLHKRAPDLDWIVQIRGQQVGRMAQQLAEILGLPLVAEVRRAADRLSGCIQLALEELWQLEQRRTDAALVDELLRTGWASHPGVPFRGIDWHAAQA